MVLHRFFRQHEPCARWEKEAVEVGCDETFEQDWMTHPVPEGYIDLGELTGFLNRTDPAILYIPIFSGRTEDGKKIVLYRHAHRENELHIQHPDGGFLLALHPGAVITTWDDPEQPGDRWHIKIDSPEWSGTATGSRMALLDEPAR